MKSFLLALSVASLVVGCSSGPKSAYEKEVVTEDKYDVLERQPAKAPEWVLDYQKFRDDAEGKGIFYFTEHSGEVTDQLTSCDLATAGARKKMAQEIATFITNKLERHMAEANAGGSVEAMTRISNKLQAESQAFLAGVKDAGQFWEKRDYTKSGRKAVVFICHGLVKVDEKAMKENLERASSKTLAMKEVAQSAALKEAVKTDIMGNIEKAVEEFKGASPAPASN